jgi:hypothetical protein
MLDEIKKAISDGELDAKDLAKLLKKDFVVRTKDEEATYIAKIKEATETEVKANFPQPADTTKELTDTIAKAFGEAKKDDETLDAYIGRIKETTATSDAKAQWLEGKLSDMQKAIADKEAQIEQIQNEAITSSFKSELKTYFAGKKLKGVEDEYKDKELELIERTLLSRYKPKKEGDKLVVFEGDKLLRDEQTYEPLPIHSLLEKEFGYKIQTEEPVQRSGTGVGKPAPSQSKPVVSREEAYKAAADKGLSPGSPNWVTFVRESTSAN